MIVLTFKQSDILKKWIQYLFEEFNEELDKVDSVYFMEYLFEVFKDATDFGKDSTLKITRSFFVICVLKYEMKMCRIYGTLRKSAIVRHSNYFRSCDFDEDVKKLKEHDGLLGDIEMRNLNKKVEEYLQKRLDMLREA